jgi:hypothetical protein
VAAVVPIDDYQDRDDRSVAATAPTCHTARPIGQ